jgi:hypothetical protein
VGEVHRAGVGEAAAVTAAAATVGTPGEGVDFIDAKVSDDGEWIGGGEAADLRGDRDRDLVGHAAAGDVGGVGRGGAGEIEAIRAGRGVVGYIDALGDGREVAGAGAAGDDRVIGQDGIDDRGADREIAERAAGWKSDRACDCGEGGIAGDADGGAIGDGGAVAAVVVDPLGEASDDNVHGGAGGGIGLEIGVVSDGLASDAIGVVVDGEQGNGHHQDENDYHDEGAPLLAGAMKMNGDHG